jgi:Rieske Fe-S protein
MGKCSLCGNEYDKSFIITQGGESRIFDSFECAIQAMAPQCAHCGCRIIGHGLEADGQFFCCAHCAKHMGHVEMKDREH